LKQSKLKFRLKLCEVGSWLPGWLAGWPAGWMDGWLAGSEEKIWLLFIS
jgi:hypothetical protein